jgi:hypothetical protein
LAGNFQKNAVERAAAGVEATFSLPAAKCDNLTCDNFGLAALRRFYPGPSKPMLPAPALCSHFCPLVPNNLNFVEIQNSVNLKFKTGTSIRLTPLTYQIDPSEQLCNRFNT